MINFPFMTDFCTCLRSIMVSCTVDQSLPTRTGTDPGQKSVTRLSFLPDGSGFQFRGIHYKSTSYDVHCQIQTRLYWLFTGEHPSRRYFLTVWIGDRTRSLHHSLGVRRRSVSHSEYPHLPGQVCTVVEQRFTQATGLGMSGTWLTEVGVERSGGACYRRVPHFHTLPKQKRLLSFSSCFVILICNVWRKFLNVFVCGEQIMDGM